MADTPLFFRRTLQGLRPDDVQAEEALRSVGQGEVVALVLKRPRNSKHHRKFFALLKLVYENQEHYESMDALLIALKVALGHCFPVILRTGQTAYVPKSISFAKMSQDEFEVFYEGVVKIVVTKFLPGVNREDLEAEIMTMVS